MQYVELHCKSNFSFLRGASHPDELVQQAARLGYRGLAITDEASVAGVVRGFAPAKEAGLQYIVGTEVCPHGRAGDGVVADRSSILRRMCRLISRGRLRAEKGSYDLAWQDVVELSEGILAAVLPLSGTGQASLSRFLRTQFRDVFDDRAYLLCELHRGVDDAGQLERLHKVSVGSDVPLVAAGDVHYHEAARMLMHDCVTAIGDGSTIDQVHDQRFANSQRHLRSLAEIKHLYRDAPELLTRTVEIADRCHFSLDELRYEYPKRSRRRHDIDRTPEKRLTWEGAKQRWPGGCSREGPRFDTSRNAADRRLALRSVLLNGLGPGAFCPRARHFVSGRGSAANSVVCYCLGSRTLIQSNGSFVRTICQRERNEAPDIDVDFEHQRREEVLQYLYEKYGRDRAGMTATVTTYRTKSAVREVGKALGVSADAIDSIAKLGGSGAEFSERCRAGGLDPDSDDRSAVRVSR